MVSYFVSELSTLRYVPPYFNQLDFLAYVDEVNENVIAKLLNVELQNVEWK